MNHFFSSVEAVLRMFRRAVAPPPLVQAQAASTVLSFAPAEDPFRAPHPPSSRDLGAEAPTKGYAPFGKRFLSGLIDCLILLIPTAIGSMIVPLLGGFIVSFAYFIYFMTEKGGGQTLGDRAVGVRTVDEATRHPMGVQEAFLWCLVFNFVGWLGWIWYFFDDRKRMLHNVVSRSVTVVD